MSRRPRIVFFPYRHRVDAMPEGVNPILARSWQHAGPSAGSELHVDSDFDLEEWTENICTWEALTAQPGPRLDFEYSTSSTKPADVLLGDVTLATVLMEKPVWPPVRSLMHAERYHTNPAWPKVAKRAVENAPLRPAAIAAVVERIRAKAASPARAVRLKLMGQQKVLPPLIIPPVMDEAEIRAEVWGWAEDFLIQHEGDMTAVLVQEEATVEFETRLFVVNGAIVTGSGQISELTPLARGGATVCGHDLPDCYSLIYPWVARTRGSSDIQHLDRVYELPFLGLAQSLAIDLVAADPELRHFVMDVALINGELGVVELNPIHRSGLFASDPVELVAAILMWSGRQLEDGVGVGA